MIYLKFSLSLSLIQARCLCYPTQLYYSYLLCTILAESILQEMQTFIAHTRAL
jgi:hypothetical protein